MPQTRLIPVPAGASQRQRAKRVPETVGPPCVKLFRRSAPKPHPCSEWNLAPPVSSAQLASMSTFQPHCATR